MNMSIQEEVTFDNIFNNKIEDIKSSFEKLRNNEFEKIDFEYKEIEIIKKDINVDTKD